MDSRSQPVQIILNPNSAGGKGRKVRPRLEASLRQAGLSYELHETEAPGHGRDLAARLRGASRARLLIVGGDGTIHEVVNGLLEGGGASEPDLLPEIAVLPMGTGNDFFRMIRAPRGVDGAVQVLGKGVATSFDVGHVRWEGGEGYFVNLVGVGIDVAVLKARSSYTFLPGLLQYLAAFGSALRGFRPVPVEVTLHRGEAPAKVVAGQVLLAAVTVGPSIGGGFMIAPGARRGDGLLDFFLAHRMGLGRIAMVLRSVLRGTQFGGPEVVQEQVTEVHLAPSDESGLNFEMDGEWRTETPSSLTIRVLPRILRVLEIPGGSPR